MAGPLTRWDRKRFARAEVWMLLACVAQGWSDQVAGTGRGLPFAEWDDDDPLKKLCARFDLTPADLAGVIEAVAQTAETSALNAGYGTAPDPEGGER